MRDGRTDGRTDRAATICAPFGEHKNKIFLLKFVCPPNMFVNSLKEADSGRV